MRRAISTICDLLHIRLYNYYLMDLYIDRQAPMKYNPEIRCFEFDESNDRMSRYNEDKDVEEEINEIKCNVLKKDRHNFLNK